MTLSLEVCMTKKKPMTVLTTDDTRNKNRQTANDDSKEHPNHEVKDSHADHNADDSQILRSTV